VAAPHSGIYTAEYRWLAGLGSYSTRIQAGGQLGLVYRQAQKVDSDFFVKNIDSG